MATNPSIVMIISAGRSGSKFLRDVLGRSRHCAAIPYDINFVWRQGNDSLPHDQLQPEHLTDSQRADIRSRILGLPNWRGKSDPRILLEKTVSNSLRVAFAHKIFPEARFIHLVRDGRAVAESARRVWSARPGFGYSINKLRLLRRHDLRYVGRYAFNLVKPSGVTRASRSWGPRYANMDHDLARLDLLSVCAEQWRTCVTHATSSLAMSGAPLLTVRYEDLVENSTVIQDVAEFAGLPDVSVVSAAWRNQLTPNHAEKWRRTLSTSECSMLGKRLEKELALFGYEPRIPVQTSTGEVRNRPAERF